MRLHLRLWLVAVGCAVALTALASALPDRFARSTIDVGLCVSDVERSARFYTEAIGFTEAPGFEVSPSVGAGAGLTDNRGFRVRVFVLKDEPTATRLKLIQFAGARPKRVDNRYVESSLGMRYLTILVTDMTEAVERARRAGATPLAKGPYALGGGSYLTLLRDPDGNLVELVGPAQ